MSSKKKRGTSKRGTRRKMSKVDRIFYKNDRERIWKEQNYKCYYCPKVLKLKETTLDHVIPISKIGFCHSTLNAVVACVDCNSKKGNSEHYEYVPEVVTGFEKDLNDMMERLDERIKRAQYALSFKTFGSYRRWKKHHEKNGRWKYGY